LFTIIVIQALNAGGRMNKTILLVEDDAIIAFSEKMALEQYGYTVITTGSGERAVELINRIPGIDLVLMDIDLGSGMDGTEAAVRILEKHELPIVFLSSHTEPEILEKTEKTTSYGYVVKSSSITVLDASIKMAFRLFEANKTLRESEERFRVLYRENPDPIFIWNLDDTLHDANDAACRMLGYDREELLSLSLPDIQAPSVRRQKGGIIKSELERIRFEGMDIDKEGKEIPVEVVSVPVTLKGKQYALSSTRDISDRKRVEELLQQREETLKALFSSMTEVVVLHELVFSEHNEVIDYRILDCNKAFTEVTGIKKEDAVGKSASEVYGESPPPFLERYARVARAGAADSFTTYYPPLDKHLSISVVSPKVNHFATVANDITELKRAEEAIRQKLEENELLLREVHHRVKNNIASIGSLLSLQLQDAEGKAAGTVLKDALGRVESMKVLYEKLLSGKDYVDIPAKEYVMELVDTIVELFPDGSAIRIECSIDDALMNTKELFPLGLIINELLTNAMKYAFTGRQQGKISLALRINNGTRILALEDNGKGLPGDFSVEASGGFGLSLVSMLSEQLGGRFSLSGKAGAGTRCVLEF
jgi:two-component system, sensor histidine kinase PdtaS